MMFLLFHILHHLSLSPPHTRKICCITACWLLKIVLFMTGKRLLLLILSHRSSHLLHSTLMSINTTSTFRCLSCRRRRQRRRWWMSSISENSFNLRWLWTSSFFAWATKYLSHLRQKKEDFFHPILVSCSSSSWLKLPEQQQSWLEEFLLFSYSGEWLSFHF